MNINAMGTINKLNTANSQMKSSSSSIASGTRLNSAADDASALAIAMKMQSQIGGTNQAIRNATSGISLIQIADGALGNTNAMVSRMKELSIQSANGIFGDTERGFMQLEIDQLMSEINRISSTTNYNGIKLLDGSLSGNNSFNLQIGANNASEQRLSININSMNANSIGLRGFNVSTVNGALSSIGMSDSAISLVSGQRASLGATQNRLEHTVNSLMTSNENQIAALSRISDADMAEEMINYTKNSVLKQTAIAMLAHQIREPQGMLSLLQQAAVPFNSRI
ncbi:MAG: flagellin [Oscillospiraceae bacterium]|nr:flagellin [Oscillospiraceae bacterium]